MRPDQLQLFDPDDEKNVVVRRLPHWQQAGAISFITWRTHDSMPSTVVKAWEEERIRWLLNQGISTAQAHSGIGERLLASQIRREYKRYFQNRWMDALDHCHGECVLRDLELASIVTESFHYFDGQRYLLTDYVVMPNHIHLLVAFPDNESMMAQCESWKHFTATRINQLLNRKGRFWQQDDFDHLVRSETQFRYLRDYIRDNPTRARLKSGEFAHYSRKDV